MNTRHTLCTLALALSSLLSGCYTVPTLEDDDDSSGAVRLEQMRAINAQMQQILAQRQGAYSAPANAGSSQYTPPPSSASVPSPRPRCLSSELMCAGNDYKCQARIAGLPRC